MTYDIVLSKSILKVAKSKGVTVESLSRAVGFDIVPFLNNNRSWPYSVVVIISVVLDVGLDELSGVVR